MAIIMQQDRPWKTGVLRKGQRYTLPHVHERMLVAQGSARFEHEQPAEAAVQSAPETATANPVAEATTRPKKRRSRRR